MIPLQTATDLHQVMSTNDATIVGTLMVICITFGAVIVYLFKSQQALNKEYIAALMANNEALIKVNNFQNEFVSNLVYLQKNK